ncbi:ABC transporter ATP-binding protein [Anaerocolumna sp. MB42-C2]|uniref:ABC transporter ATP-binding protein n=1 Tax=Anaerocolumna sp. MB42-C2 TaxID=3070997 RepID=UPI0027DF69D7|nr:ABC transporter ATP-binding protein [Anaerocolumna sp. MB42-C2]WMJ89085.1 ABC transporter ATP-binding protein [Anaerocolumna sp. MB42-C2]
MALLQISELSKKYGEITAVDNVSFDVNAGEIVALIGKNGAGKTSILNCISGNLYPTKGDVIYRNHSLLKVNSKLNEFGILIEPNFYEYLNAYDNLKLLLQITGIKDKEQINKEIIDTLKLVELLPKKNKYVKTFSFGMKQRLGLAEAIINNPNFLILDEPFVGLDPIGKKMLKNLILNKSKGEKAGVLFSSHDLSDVTEICDRVVMIHKGKVVYNDKFKITKQYSMTVNMDMGKLAGVSEMLGKNISVEGNKILFTDTEVLKLIVLKLEEQKEKILDISVKESSLYDFFEGSVLDENSD